MKKNRIFIFLNAITPSMPLLPYYDAVNALNDANNTNDLFVLDINFLHFEYDSYLVMDNRVVVYNQHILDSGLHDKEIRVSHNLPKLFRAGMCDQLIKHNYESNTYSHITDQMHASLTLADVS